MFKSFLRQEEIDNCTVKQKRINYPNNSQKESCFWVCVIGFDPITERRKEVWSLSGKDKEELWQKAKNYAERYHY